MNTKKIFSLLLTISGLLIITYYSRWEITLGIYLVIFGSNIERRLQWRDDISKYDKGEL